MIFSLLTLRLPVFLPRDESVVEGRWTELVGAGLKESVAELALIR